MRIENKKIVRWIALFLYKLVANKTPHISDTEEGVTFREWLFGGLHITTSNHQFCAYTDNDLFYLSYSEKYEAGLLAIGRS